MPVPKKIRKIEETVTQALQTVEQMGHPTEINTSHPKPLKKVGRPSPVQDRSAKIHFCLSEETFSRFSLAFPQERLKRRKAGEMIDKSLLIEEAMKSWLDSHKY